MGHLDQDRRNGTSDEVQQQNGVHMSRALLVIDVQNEYFPGGGLPLWQPEETEARILPVIGKARSAGDKIVLVRHLSRDGSGLFSEGSHGAAIRPEILVAAEDAPIVTKFSADAFQDTSLSVHLSDIDELLVCGMMTQNCVVFTALSALASVPRLSVVGDLCAAPSQVVHQIALGALGSKLPVVSSDEI
jgi:nicotinamidase-related amidase